jgi:uncharacterized phage-associated protein
MEVDIMYKVLDICRFVINYCNDNDYSLSNLKLQKILYFIQAYYLSNTDSKQPCFSEKIEAWVFGPVVPVAYHEFKQFGNTNIPRISNYIVYDESNFWDSKIKVYDDSNIDDVDKNTIRRIVDKFANFSTTSLVNITHRQTPWLTSYKKGENNEITIESIRSYFNG